MKSFNAAPREKEYVINGGSAWIMNFHRTNLNPFSNSLAFGVVTLRFPLLFDASGQGIQGKKKENKENSRDRTTNILLAVYGLRLLVLLLIKCRRHQCKVVNYHQFSIYVMKETLETVSWIKSI